MASDILLYGATGYTGKLICERAKSEGLSLVLAGRNKDKLQALSEQYDYPFLAFSLEDKEALRKALESAALVLHAAGPFSETWAPMVSACLDTKTHYLDITGEIDVFERCATLDVRAKEAGIMLMPGVGFDVVPSDCLAKYISEQCPNSLHLTLAILSTGKASRGTTKTAAQMVGLNSKIRRGGVVIDSKELLEREFDFGKGAVPSMSVSWGDVATAYYSTGIPDVDVYFPLNRQLEKLKDMPALTGWFLRSRLGQKIIRSKIDKGAEGPNAEERARSYSILLAEVVDGARHVSRVKMKTPEGYTLTAQTSVEIAKRVLGGEFKPGYQTPSLVYGADFILSFEGVERGEVTRLNSDHDTI